MVECGLTSHQTHYVISGTVLRVKSPKQQCQRTEKENKRTKVLPCPALDLHLMGKSSAAGQPTRPTQPFIPAGSISV